MISGFHVADLALRGKTDAARLHMNAIHRANSLPMEDHQPSFPEFVHGQDLTGGGTPLLGWSAAAGIIGEQALHGRQVIRTKGLLED